MLSLALFFLAEGEGHNKVSPLLDPHGWGLVFWTGCSFLLVLVLLKRTAWGPILAALEKRENTIRSQLAAAEKDRADAARLLEDHKKQLEKVRNEAQAILNEAAADQKRMLEEAHAKANAEAEATKQRAIRDIELAKSKAVDELRQKSVDLALGLAEKVIGSEVDRAKQRRLIEDFVKDYERN